MTVIAADGLYKRDVFSKYAVFYYFELILASAGFPDPFAVATMSGEQTRTTSVIKKTLNPYWNESFDMLGNLSVWITLMLILCQESNRREHPSYPNI